MVGKIFRISKFKKSKLNYFLEFARNGSADFVNWSANFVNQTGTRLTEIIDESRRKMQEFDESLENPVNI